MKLFKFKVIEHYMLGAKPVRIVEVYARTQRSAWKKVYEIQGNRTWDIELLGDSPSTAR